MMCQRHEIIVVHVVREIMLFLEEMCTLRPGGDGSGWAASVLLALSCFNAELWSLTQGDVRAVWLQQCRCPLQVPLSSFCGTSVSPFFFPRSFQGW